MTVPQDLLARGVARITCAQCSFGFVMRLGDPNANKKEKPERDPLKPVEIEGVTSSRSTASTVGEIGAGQREAFIPAQTKSNIKLSPEFQAMIAEDEARMAEAGSAEQAEASAPQPAPPALGRGVNDIPTAVDSIEELQPASAAPTEKPSAPPLMSPVTTAPTPEAAGGSGAPLQRVSSAPPPTPATPKDDSGGFEAFGVVDDVPATAPAPAEMVGLDTPPPPGSAPAPNLQRATDLPAIPDQTRLTGPFQAQPRLEQAAPQTANATPVAMSPAATQAPLAASVAASVPPLGLTAAELELYNNSLEGPREGRFVRFVGQLMLLTIIGVLGFSLFVLYRNDWNVDFSNLDTMFNRAMGHATPPAQKSLLEQLEPSRPSLALAKFANGNKVLTASGVVRNSNMTAVRYLHVSAQLLEGKRIVARAEAPAGNSFTPGELATHDKGSLYDLTNPAGKNGRNTKIAPQRSVDYMVVFTDVPEDFKVGGKYTVKVKVSKAERYEGP